MNNVVTSNDLELIVFGADDLRCMSRAHESDCTGLVSHRFRNSHGRDIPVCSDVMHYVNNAAARNARCECLLKTSSCWSVQPI